MIRAFRFRRVCQACGDPARRGDRLVRAGDFRIHRSHTRDASTGFYLGRRR